MEKEKPPKMETGDHQILAAKQTTDAVKELSEKSDIHLLQHSENGKDLKAIAKNTEPKEIQKMQIVDGEPGDDDEDDFNSNTAGAALWKMLRGAPGHTPVKGKEYYTDQEKEDLINEILPKATPILGKHFYTDKDRQELSDAIFARVRIPEDGKTPVKGVDYNDGKPGKDADENAITENVTERVLTRVPKA